MKITDKHVFFFSNKCPFSNFYPCSFLHTYNKETHRFFTTEQAFMWIKAKTFDDEETANKILQCNLDPRECKKLGRQVKNYDETVWDDVRGYMMYSVNLDKFSQDEKLKEFILDKQFDGKTFVEASPFDKIWGIGMSSDDPGIDDENNWKGSNLQGRVITQVRQELIRRSNDNK